MKLIIFQTIMLFGLFWVGLSANDAVSYMETLRRTRQANSIVESQILVMPTEQLINQLAPYYSDTMALIRQKAYHLTFRSGIGSDLNSERNIAIRRLLDGVNDRDGGIVGQTLRFLQQFSRNDFDDEAKSFISGIISQTRIPHYRELVLLAGYVGAGMEELEELFLDADLSQSHRWQISLALARMGDASQTAYIVNLVKRLPVNNDLTEYVLPDLIYTRKREAIDYCVELLFIDDKNCESHHPDISEKISCAWMILPLLANVIADIPVTIDASGDIAGDYQKALQDSRNWLLENKEYEILDISF